MQSFDYESNFIREGCQGLFEDMITFGQEKSKVFGDVWEFNNRGEKIFAEEHLCSFAIDICYFASIEFDEQFRHRFGYFMFFSFHVPSPYLYVEYAGLLEGLGQILKEDEGV